MDERSRLPRQLSFGLAALLALQAGLGLWFSHLYRDAEWIRATWFGNDWTTLVVAVPLLLAGAARASEAGKLLWLGLLGYALYNGAFYLFGAALNAFFPFYVATMVLAAFTLVLALLRVEAGPQFLGETGARAIGGYLVFVAAGLASIWFGTWGAHVFAGRPTPVEPEAFKLVAALDTTLMVPALALGGVLLWRRHPWGHVAASIAGVQASLYLLVLTVNSVVSIQRGLTAAPGELPIWGSLLVPTAIATAVLLGSARSGHEPQLA